MTPLSCDLLQPRPTDVIIDLGSSDARVDLLVQRSPFNVAMLEGTLVVRVQRDGVPVEGVIVNFSNGGGVATAIDGMVEKDLPRGQYTVSADGVARTDRVVAGIARSVGLTLESDQLTFEAPTLQLEEVFVMGTFDPSGFELSERDTDGVVDTIEVELLARFSDSMWPPPWYASRGFLSRTTSMYLFGGWEVGM